MCRCYPFRSMESLPTIGTLAVCPYHSSFQQINLNETTQYRSVVVLTWVNARDRDMGISSWHHLQDVTLIKVPTLINHECNIFVWSTIFIHDCQPWFSGSRWSINDQNFSNMIHDQSFVNGELPAQAAPATENSRRFCHGDWRLPCHHLELCANHWQPFLTSRHQ